MASEIKVFENGEFGSIRTMVIEGEPWFVGKDMASSLGYSNPRKALIDHIDNEDKTDGVTIHDSIGREQKPVFINESGLYSLVMSSKLESTKRFKRWVTSEVLPSIRKNGGYIANQESLSDSELLARAVLVAQRTIAERERQLAAANETVKLMTPKADYYDELVEREHLTNFRDTAKELGVKERMFISWLINRKIVYRQGKHGRLTPYADSLAKGWFEVKDYSAQKQNACGVQTLFTVDGKQAVRAILAHDEDARELMSA